MEWRPVRGDPGANATGRVPLGVGVVVAGGVLFVLLPFLVFSRAVSPWGSALLYPFLPLLLLTAGIVVLARGDRRGRRLPLRMPDRDVVRWYLWFLAGALAAVALLFVVNVFFPLGKGFPGRAGGTVARLMLGWLWGLGGLLLLSWRPTWAAGAIGLATGAAVIVFGGIGVWGLAGSYDFDQVWQGLMLVQVFVLAGTPAWVMVGRDGGDGAAWISLGATAAAGLVTGLSAILHGTGGALDPRWSEAFGPFGFAFAAAAALLLVPERPGLMVARWMWHAAPIVLAVAAVVAPWLPTGTVRDGMDVVDRLWLAAWVVAAVLALIGGTSWLFMRLRVARTVASRSS